MSRFAHTIAALQINALPRSPNARSRNAKKRERKQAVIVRSSKPSDVCASCFQPIAPGAEIGVGRAPHISNYNCNWPQFACYCLECITAERSGPWRWREARPCPGCGRLMRPDRSLLLRDNHCCCEDCAYQRRLAKARQIRKVRHDPAVCPVCGEEFIPKREDAVCCSNACRQRAYRKREGAS
jgi:hypothetical protein